MDPETQGPYSGNGSESGKSAGQLFKEVTEDISTLIRKEIELAKQELGSAVSAKVKGLAAIAVLGVLAFFALIFMMLSIRDALVTVMGGWTWLADILTAVILLVIGALAGLFAKKKLSTPISAEMTKQSLKEDVELAKTMGRRN